MEWSDVCKVGDWSEFLIFFVFTLVFLVLFKLTVKYGHLFHII